MPGIITHSNSSMSRQALRQQAEKHRLVRLFRGAYMDAQEYAALDISGRYRARAQAFLATHAKLRAWGITAAALEGTLFEGASTSPLPDALLAANYLLRRSSAKAQGGLVACRDIDESTTEALVWEPATSGSGEASIRSAFDTRMLDMEEPEFLANYSAARVTGFVSPEAELLWLAFAQLCFANGGKRGIRSALKAGLYFTDQVESPAESLLIARCAELGFEIPYLQVNILDPSNGRHLGRVEAARVPRCR